MKSKIKAYVQELEEHNITPLFVFHGMSLRSRGLDENICKSNLQTSYSAWSDLDSGRKNSAAAKFSSLRSRVVPSEIVLYAMQVLKDFGVECIISPSSANAQLAILASSSRRFVQACVGGAVLSLHGVDRVIQSLDTKVCNLQFSSTTEFDD